MESDFLLMLKEMLYIVAGPIIATIGWFGKKMHKKIEENTKEINNLKVSQAVQDTLLKEIDKKQDKMDKKLDKILDKIT